MGVGGSWSQSPYEASEPSFIPTRTNSRPESRYSVTALYGESNSNELVELRRRKFIWQSGRYGRMGSWMELGPEVDDMKETTFVHQECEITWHGVALFR